MGWVGFLDFLAVVYNISTIFYSCILAVTVFYRNLLFDVLGEHLALANPQAISGDAFSFTVSSFLGQWNSPNEVAMWEYTECSKKYKPWQW